MQYAHHHPIMIRVYPRKWGWPDLPHFGSNLSNSNSPSRSIHGKSILKTHNPSCRVSDQIIYMQKFVDSHWSRAVQFSRKSCTEICNASANYKIQIWFKFIFHCLQQKTILAFVKQLNLSEIYNYGTLLKIIQLL